MCGEAFWKGIVVFCLAFWLGWLADYWFAPKQLPKLEIKHQALSAKPEDVELNIPPGKPQCKSFSTFTQKYVELLMKKLDLSVKIEKLQKQSSPKQLEIYRQQLRKIEFEIQILMMESKSRIYLHSESKPAHNLLYIPGCVEYY